MIKSISGIRGTIGAKPGENLTPVDVVKFAAAYGSILTEKRNLETGKKITVVIGRDGRISGEMIQQLVTHTLTALGIDAVGNTPEQLGAILRADLEKWTAVAKSAGVKAE